MRAVVSSILFALLAWNLPASAAESPLEGTWGVKWKCAKALSPNCMADSFSLRLFIKNGRLCGAHSSVAKGGNKVDELGGSDPTLAGQVVGTTAVVTFFSSFEGKGKATINLKGKHLQWHITEGEGEHWLPPDAILQRVRSTTWGAQLKCGWPK
jgi:hypothetical protein